jgi:hypothetical protein
MCNSSNSPFSDDNYVFLLPPNVCTSLNVNNYIQYNTPRLENIYVYPSPSMSSSFCAQKSTFLLFQNAFRFPIYTILYINFAIKKHANPNTINPPVKHQNQVKLPSYSCPGTHTFIPHRPVMIFIGSTMVPRTVSLPRTSAVCSCRSFILMLI